MKWYVTVNHSLFCGNRHICVTQGYTEQYYIIYQVSSMFNVRVPCGSYGRTSNGFPCYFHSNSNQIRLWQLSTYQWSHSLTSIWRSFMISINLEAKMKIYNVEPINPLVTEPLLCKSCLIHQLLKNTSHPHNLISKIFCNVIFFCPLSKCFSKRSAFGFVCPTKPHILFMVTIIWLS